MRVTEEFSTYESNGMTTEGLFAAPHAHKMSTPPQPPFSRNANNYDCANVLSKLLFAILHHMGSLRISVAILLMTLVLLGGLGASHFGLNMKMQMDGSMSSNCFMPGMTAALCQMNPLEHIASWQSMFTMLPSQNDIVSLLLLLLTSLLGLAWIGRIPIRAPSPRISTAQRFRREPFPPNPLQELFSSGILNPKLF